jgi:hypothetical protein
MNAGGSHRVFNWISTGGGSAFLLKFISARDQAEIGRADSREREKYCAAR